MINIFINGFGRIGSSIYKLIKDDKEFNIVGINELNPIKVDDIPIFSTKDPKELNLKDVDILIQSSGVYLTKKSNEVFLTQGAKRVLITTPSDAPTFIYNINHKNYQNQSIISASSCSATAITPIIKTFEKFEIVSLFATMIHSYTNDQPLLDKPKAYQDIRRVRSATQNILPLYSTAPKAVKRFFPDLNIEAKSIRVPLAYTTFYDLTLKVKKSIFDIKSIIEQNLDYTYEEVVSSDFIGSKSAITIDMNFTNSFENMIKISGWQDNEIGYCAQVVKLIKALFG